MLLCPPLKPFNAPIAEMCGILPNGVKSLDAWWRMVAALAGWLQALAWCDHRQGVGFESPAASF